ncbi:hypothetical protein TNCV_3035141 [Trichonephila clavipes]|nr:hypothetical protein TNCV_3035141 [Trichonephila clavipes]
MRDIGGKTKRLMKLWHFTLKHNDRASQVAYQQDPAIVRAPALQNHDELEINLVIHALIRERSKTKKIRDTKDLRAPVAIAIATVTTKRLLRTFLRTPRKPK